MKNSKIYTTRKLPRVWAVIALSCWCLSNPAGAQSDSDLPNTSVVALPREISIADGRATRTWLKKQSEGDGASRQQQYLSGPAMRRAHERYLKTFEQPIPESFEGGTSLTGK